MCYDKKTYTRVLPWLPCGTNQNAFPQYPASDLVQLCTLSVLIDYHVTVLITWPNTLFEIMFIRLSFINDASKQKRFSCSWNLLTYYRQVVAYFFSSFLCQNKLKVGFFRYTYLVNQCFYYTLRPLNRKLHAIKMIHKQNLSICPI